jgi:hypothetical protein
MRRKTKKMKEGSDSLTCSGNEEVRLSLTTTLVFPNRSSRDFRRKEGFLFQFSLVVAPVLSVIFYPGLRSLRSLTPGYQYVAPLGQGPQMEEILQ